jgi:hypothetical protein
MRRTQPAPADFDDGGRRSQGGNIGSLQKLKSKALEPLEGMEALAVPMSD